MPVRQTALFRTKGWPGLNAPATPGGDLAPFVEASYPRTPEQLLYRDEPILLAMNERFAPLAPAVDAPPTAPPERRQLLEWSMLVDEVGAGEHGAVATYSSPDWLTANRQQPGPPGPLGARLRRRPLAAARGAQPRPALRPARRHPPQPGELPAARPDAAQLARVHVRGAGGRLGAQRLPRPRRAARRAVRHAPAVAFEPDDLTALTMLGGARGRLDGRRRRARRSRRRRAGVGRARRPAWVHVHLAPTSTPRRQRRPGRRRRGRPRTTRSWPSVDAATSRLRLERRSGGAHELAAEAVIPAVAGPVTLELIAYDDEVVARVGDAEVRDAAPATSARDGSRSSRARAHASPGCPSSRSRRTRSTS